MFKSKNNNIIFSDFQNNRKLKDNFADANDCEKSPIKDCENQDNWPCCGGRDFSNDNKDSPWICISGNPFRQDGKGNTIIDEDKVKTGIEKYNDIRNGNGTDKQNEIIQKLINNPNFCSMDNQEAKIHMTNNSTKTGDGYSLGCVDSNGEPVPNCACDPNCWPNTLGCMNEVNGSFQATSCYWPNDKPDDMSAPTSADEGKPDDSGTCPPPNTQNLNENISDIASSMGMDQVCTQYAYSAEANGEMHGKLNAFSMLKGNIGASFGASMSENSNQGCAQRTLNVMRNTTNIQNLQCSMAKTDASASVSNGSRVSITVKPAEGPNVDAITNRLADAVDRALQNVSKTTRMVTKSRNLTSETAQQLIDLAKSQLEFATEAQETRIKNVDFKATNDVTIINGIDNTVTSALSVISNSMSDLRMQVRDNITNEFGTGALGDNENEVIDNEVYQNLTNLTQSIIDIKAAADIKGDESTNITVYYVPGQKIENVKFDASNKVNLAQSVINDTVQSIANEISTQMILDAANDLENHTKHSGLNDLVDAIGEANRKNQEVGDDWIGGGDWIWIIIGIVVIVGIVMLFMPGDDGESAATKLAKTASDSQKSSYW